MPGLTEDVTSEDEHDEHVDASEDKRRDSDNVAVEVEVERSQSRPGVFHVMSAV